MGQSVRFRAPSEQAVRSIVAALARRGYGLLRSFDLRSACGQHPEDCTCPHHGTAECTCQYVVALAYPPAQGGLMAAPQVLTAHTYDDTTIVTVPSNQAADGKNRRVVMGAVMEAAGALLDPCADELEPCSPAPLQA